MLHNNNEVKEVKEVNEVKEVKDRNDAHRTNQADILNANSTDEIIKLDMLNASISRELVDFFKKYSAAIKKNKSNPAVSTIGIGVGTIASLEFYLLGMEFVEIMAQLMNTTNPIAILLMQHVFGILSFVPNSSMNILVNMEIANDIYNIFRNKSCNKTLAKQILTRLPIFAHSLTAAFTITTMFMNSVSTWNLPLRVILGLCTFASNSVLFYYTDMDSIYSIYRTLRYLKREPHEKKLVDALHARLKQLQSEASRITTNGNELTFSTSRIFKDLVKTPFVPAERSSRFTPGKIALGITGLTIGSLGVVSYLSVGSQASKFLCEMIQPESDTCMFDNDATRIFLGANTFLAFLLFSTDQSIEGLYFIQDRILSIIAHQQPVSLFIVMTLFSLASSIANGAIATNELLSDQTMSVISLMLIVASFASPFLVNNRWFNDMYERISNQWKASAFCQEKKHPSHQPLMIEEGVEGEKMPYAFRAEIRKRNFLSKRNHVIDVLKKIGDEVDTSSPEDLVVQACNLSC